MGVGGNVLGKTEEVCKPRGDMMDFLQKEKGIKLTKEGWKAYLPRAKIWFMLFLMMFGSHVGAW